jgi:GH15 family glucan-1,4-alpha-glucosidase
VAADGGIVWYCPRRFDAPASLFRLLDPEGAVMRVGPAGTGRAPGEQTYDRRTNVLRTLLPATGGGELEVVDFMPWDGTSQRPEGRIVRLLTARRGPVDVEVEVTPGAAFGPARRVSTWSSGIAFDDLVVRTGVPVDGRRASTTLASGERMLVTIDLADADRHHEPLSASAAMLLLDDTSHAWRRHLGPMTYDGPYREAVERSLLALKALTYHDTGAVIAAATTSLPEELGGERNWDYRYCWIRDACMAVHAARDAGLTAESDAFTNWLAAAIETTSPPLPTVCDVAGDRPPEERELDLEGWRRSQPVRTGNAAADQLQIDLYGDLVGAVAVEQLLTDGPMLACWDAIAGAIDWLADHWQDPDHGVWELRSGPRQLLSSKLAAWSALDRMVMLARAMNPLDLAAVSWQQSARAVAAWLEASPLVTAAHRIVDIDDVDLLDASLLRVAWSGPWPADHVIVTRTVDRILRNLSEGPHVHRYPRGTDDGLPGTEGAFTACSLWAVRALATMGRWEEAHERMDAVCSLGGTTGLLSEQVDATSGKLLGNLPQALSHLSLIEAAIALDKGPR